ncbi:hypothetical protein AWB67_06110 [Caballeronia terrestris]|uniref:Uncharacterized protein n=1 Tax=Caballeronia terrestris TaxID=1226301 RepID=A0A158KPN9_9BURK|nr:hypothetical protein AWB67_06110 [Caballeronia terrestris]
MTSVPTDSSGAKGRIARQRNSRYLMNGHASTRRCPFHPRMQYKFARAGMTISMSVHRQCPNARLYPPPARIHRSSHSCLNDSNLSIVVTASNRIGSVFTLPSLVDPNLRINFRIRFCCSGRIKHIRVQPTMLRAKLAHECYVCGCWIASGGHFRQESGETLLPPRRLLCDYLDAFKEERDKKPCHCSVPHISDGLILPIEWYS